MASISVRLAALEKVVEARWGEYDKPAGSDIADVQTAGNDTELLTVLVEVLKGIKEDMATYKEAMDQLVKESAETGSAIEAFIQQQNALIATLRANAENPEAILQIANAQEAYQQRLASALVVNTPAADATKAEEPPIADPVVAPPSAEEAATVDASAVVVPETVPA